MHNLLGRIRSNLRPRMRLLLNALSQRYIWSDVSAMAREHCNYNDVTGDVDPLSFAHAVFGTNESLIPAPPDFPKNWDQQAHLHLRVPLSPLRLNPAWDAF